MLPTYFNTLARAHDCIWYHWLSVNENPCLIDGVEKVDGWSQVT